MEKTNKTAQQKAGKTLPFPEAFRKSFNGPKDMCLTVQIVPGSGPVCHAKRYKVSPHCAT